MNRRIAEGPIPLPPAYGEVFHAREDPAVFREVQWHSVLLPYGLHLEQQTARAFLHAAAAVGDETIVITDVEPIPPHQDTSRILSSLEAFERMRVGSILGHVDVRLLGDSARWGAEAAHQGLMLLGGDGEFIAAFLAMAGTASDLQDRYRRFLQEEWLEPDTAAGRLRAAVRWPITGNS